jgi:hypothetical protein
MSTQAQIDANRRNAQKSTGPKTQEGRAAVRLNGVKHGLTAETLILAGESAEDFQALLDAFEAEQQPETALEATIVRKAAICTWRLQRVYRAEAGFFHWREQALTTHSEDFRSRDEDQRLATIFVQDVPSTLPLTACGTLAYLVRYEAHLERSLYRALAELRRLRADRQKNLTIQTQSAVATKRVNNIATFPNPKTPPQPASIESDPPLGGKLEQNGQAVDASKS